MSEHMPQHFYSTFTFRHPTRLTLLRMAKGKLGEKEYHNLMQELRNLFAEGMATETSMEQLLSKQNLNNLPSIQSLIHKISVIELCAMMEEAAL